MAKEKKIINVFVLDNEGISGIMDNQGYPEKNPVLHSLGCVYEDNPDIGTKLIAPGKDGVLHAEDLQEAIENYQPNKAPKKTAKKAPKKPSKADEKKGDYDTKVMTPSK